MNAFNRLRGPRLPTKLAFLGLALLVVPWFSYKQLVEMERLLIQGQQTLDDRDYPDPTVEGEHL